MNFGTLSMRGQTDDDRFRYLMDIVPHLVWMAGPDKRCIYCNQGWLEFTGRPVAKELGYGWTDNIHGDDVERWVATYQQAFQAHKPFSIEYRLRRHDGAYRWLLHDANPMFSREKDSLEGYIGACVDITDRRCAEESLRETRAKFRELFECNALPIFYWHRDGRILDANPAYLRLVGGERGELEGGNLRWSDFADLRCLTLSPEAVAERAPGRGATEGLEGEYVCPDGRHVAMLVAGSVAPEDPDRGVACAVDLTARRRTESALRSSEALLRAVFASLYGNVAVVDREGCIVSANGAWTQFARHTTGFSREAYVGANYLDVCRRAAAAGDRSAAAAVNGIESVLLAHAPGYSQEYSCPSEHGPWYELVIVPLRRQEGGALIFHIDVTSRVRAEGEAQRLRNELSHVTRVSILGELVASLAHELNQPLTAILSNTQAALRLLGKGASAPDELREILEDIAMDDQRAGEIIRRLRQLTRKGEFVLQHIDVNQLVREVYGLLESDSLIRRVPMECRFAPDLPPVLGDRIQLEQVLLNLMINGLESMKDLPQDGNLRLVVSTRRASEASIIVAVKDRGIGVTPDKQGSIFKPFFSTKPDGMGMGLSICRTIVLAHNGRIGVSNNPDGGATFEVELPITREVSSGSG
jgi:PAS domain S-box-containing protein